MRSILHVALGLAIVGCVPLIQSSAAAGPPVTTAEYRASDGAVDATPVQYRPYRGFYRPYYAYRPYYGGYAPYRPYYGWYGPSYAYPPYGYTSYYAPYAGYSYYSGYPYYAGYRAYRPYRGGFYGGW